MYKMDLQKAEEPNCQHLLEHRKSKRIPEKHILCFIDYAKAFDDGTTLPASWETCMQVKKQEIET